MDTKQQKNYDKFKTQTNFYGASMTRMIAYQHNVHVRFDTISWNIILKMVPGSKQGFSFPLVHNSTTQTTSSTEVGAHKRNETYEVQGT